MQSSLEIQRIWENFRHVSYKKYKIVDNSKNVRKIEKQKKTVKAQKLQQTFKNSNRWKFSKCIKNNDQLPSPLRRVVVHLSFAFNQKQILY